MSNTPIELKGSSFTLSVIHLHDANPEVIRQALEDKIAQAPAFLRHAPVVVNISSIEDDVDWRPLHEAIAATGLLADALVLMRLEQPQLHSAQQKIVMEYAAATAMPEHDVRYAAGLSDLVLGYASDLPKSM